MTAFPYFAVVVGIVVIVIVSSSSHCAFFFFFSIGRSILPYFFDPLFCSSTFSFFFCRIFCFITLFFFSQLFCFTSCFVLSAVLFFFFSVAIRSSYFSCQLLVCTFLHFLVCCSVLPSYLFYSTFSVLYRTLANSGRSAIVYMTFSSPLSELVVTSTIHKDVKRYCQSVNRTVAQFPDP